MSIGYNTCTAASGIGYPTTISWSHTSSVLSNRIILVGGFQALVGATYGGVSLAAVPSTGNRVWYLINNASGANTVYADFGAAVRPAAAAIDFYGVDQVAPIRTAGVDTTTDTSMDVNLSCEIGDMLVGFFERYSGDTCGAWASQSPLTSPYSCCANDPTTASLHTGVSVSYGLATTSPNNINCLVTDSRALDAWVGAALMPYVPAFGRGVKYYFNIWDPRAMVRDRNDRAIAPDELRADKWLELQGVALPDPKVYTTYVEDPTKAYIVEVTASDRGASLRASRNQFADTLIKRAAAGRG